MANRISRVYELGKKNRNRSDMNNNVFIVTVSIPFCYNTYDKNIGITLNSSSTNTLLSTTSADIHEKPADSIEKVSPNNSKNNPNLIANVDVNDDAQSFKTQRNIITLSLH